MSDERRYNEDEMRQIFASVTEGGGTEQRGVARSGGTWTLAELQDIGREVGLPSDEIAQAAHSLDIRTVAAPRRSFLGLPFAVGRTAQLERPPTDREWGIIVSELRQTFNATGWVEEHGETRGWSNGNLHIYIEPTVSGYQLRMGTKKGRFIALRRATGAAALLFIVMSFFLGLLTPGGNARSLIFMLLPLMAGGALGVTALGLPAWARRREQQMDYIAERVQAIMAAPPVHTPDDSDSD